ncbi:PAS domain S-box protein [Bacillota bacterium Lsc_1132]
MNDIEVTDKEWLRKMETYCPFLKLSSDLFSLHSLDSCFVYASHAAKELLGYMSNELVSIPLVDLCHPNDRHKISYFLRHYDDFEKYRVFYRIRRKTGEYIWFESLFMTEKQSNLLYCTSRDFTEYKTTEEELEASRTKYQALVESFQDTVGIITVDGYWVYMNEAGKKLFGVTSTSEMIGRSIFDFIPYEEHRKIRDHILSHQEKEPFELTILRTDSQIRHAEAKVIPTIYKERKTFQIVIRDMTERKKTEDMMQQTEKLSVVGHLAAGIAHEIRNPLTAIKGFTQLMNQEIPNTYLDVVLTELERVENIVSDLLILAKPQASVCEKINLEKLLNDTIFLFLSEAHLHNIEFITEIQLSNPFIEGEGDKLKQVYINLLKNAIEAMPDGGHIYIKAYQPNEDCLVTQITDEGVGIPPERISRLGEPFYSTKEKGTGLGLMICNRIIKNHGGALTIDSQEDNGTTVSISLPRWLK